MSTMLQTEHLSFTYPAEEGQTSTVALEDVSLSIERGSVPKAAKKLPKSSSISID